MSDKTESMAVVADGVRDLSDDELEHVFGGCAPYYDYCDVQCVAGMPNYSYQVCFWNGSAICSSGLAWDAHVAPQCYWP